MISFPRKKPPLIQYVPYTYEAIDSAFVRISNPSEHTWVKRSEKVAWNCINCCTTPCMKDTEIKDAYGGYGTIKTQL